MNYEHVPVMLNETIRLLDIKPNGIYVDLTLGRAGHSSEILKRLTTGKLIAFDQDIEALNLSKKTLEKISQNFVLIHSNFVNVKEKLNDLGINKVDGILMDLGVSSPQFDDPERGFSYRKDSKLDMRMDQSKSLSAIEVINEYSFEKLLKVFREYGEDKYAHIIAKKICCLRENKKIITTGELVEIIKSCKPAKELAKKGHPAKQIFQAVRIEVNDELNVLKIALNDCLDLLNVDGIMAVITFQSLEDRIVKDCFKKNAIIEGSRHDVFVLPSQESKLNFKLVNKKVIVPTEKELEDNPRSKSAKVRAIRKIKE